MHELGVVFYIADDAKKAAKENGVSHIHSVTLELGEVTGVVPEYLIDCWNWNAARDPMTEGCELHIEQIDAVTYCEACKSEYPTVAYGKICPHCGSPDTYLLRGREVIVKSIEVDD